MLSPPTAPEACFSPPVTASSASAREVMKIHEAKQADPLTQSLPTIAPLTASSPGKGLIEEVGLWLA